MSARGRLLLLVVAVAVAAAGVLGYRFLRGRAARRAGLEQTLAEIDAALAAGAADRGERLISAVADIPISAADYLRLLRRARDLATTTGDYTQLADVSDRARRSLPGNDILRVIAAWAALRTGRPGDALELTAGIDAAATVWITAEATARLYETGSTAAAGEASIQGEAGSLLQTLREPRPDELLAVADSVSAGSATALILDAALLYAYSGLLTQAATQAARVAAAPEAALPAGLIAFDAGDYRLAVAALGPLAAGRAPAEATLPQLTLFYADALLLANDQGAAAREYRRLVQNDPDFWWTPFYNLAVLFTDAGDLPAAAETLRSGLEMHPDEIQLLAEAARLADVMGDAAELRAAVDSARAKIDSLRSDADIASYLAILELDPSGMSPGRYKAELWRLFNGSPRHAGLARRLVYHLLSTGDRAGARAALHQYAVAMGIDRLPPSTAGSPRRTGASAGADRDSGEGGSADLAPAGVSAAAPDWYRHTEALLPALDGELSAAATLLEAVASGGNWRASYNLGLVELRRERPEAAERAFRQAGERMPADVDPSLRALAQLGIGTTFIARGLRTAARDALQAAAEMDPANVRARLLLRELAAPEVR